MKVPPLRKILSIITHPEAWVTAESAQKAVDSLRESFEQERAHTAHLIAHTVKEPEWLYMVWGCLCGNKLVGVFPRKEGFDFTCTCGKHYEGAISGFEQKAKEAFQRCQIKNVHRKTPRSMAVNAYLAVIDVISLTQGEKDMLNSALLGLFCSETVEAE